MSEKTLVFVNEKENNKFNKYQIIEKPKPEVQSLVENFNKSDKKLVARIIDDEDVLGAIVQKESRGSIKSYCKDVERSVEDISEQISHLESEVSSFIHKIKDQLEST